VIDSVQFSATRVIHSGRSGEAS